MGNTWEIQAWRGCYAYEEFWRVESWLEAAWNLLKAKREGHGGIY